MILTFTLCSNNYLAQAITLGNSLIRFNQDYKFIIGLVDKKNPGIDYAAIPFEVIEVESIGITAFDKMFKRYSITELNTAVKPYYFQYFFNKFGTAETCIYLDPDILVYKSFIELGKVLEENEIVIIPHFTTPINDDNFQNESDFLNSGLYNLGFIALKKGQESLKFLEWWAIRLATKAHINFAKGLFTDQVWINFVPLFFGKVNIFRHPGYNMAYWNLHERHLRDTDIVVKGDICYPLVFYHFSGFNPLQPGILSKYQNRFSFENRNDIIYLFKNYSDKVFENGYNTYIKVPCFFDIEKQRINLEAYESFKRAIPLYKRFIRGIILRFIGLFKINIDYYIH